MYQHIIFCLNETNNALIKPKLMLLDTKQYGLNAFTNEVFFDLRRILE